MGRGLGQGPGYRASLWPKTEDERKGEEFGVRLLGKSPAGSPGQHRLQKKERSWEIWNPYRHVGFNLAQLMMGPAWQERSWNKGVTLATHSFYQQAG